MARYRGQRRSFNYGLLRKPWVWVLLFSLVSAIILFSGGSGGSSLNFGLGGPSIPFPVLFRW